MANPVGIFDPELSQTEWFDVTNVIQGWFDADLVYTGGVVVLPAALPDDPFDIFDQDQAYAANDADTTDLIVSTTLNPTIPQAPYFIGDDIVVADWWEDADDPTVIDAEWSGPVVPNAPPPLVEDIWDWDEHADEDWYLDQELSFLAFKPPPIDDSWDWHEEVEDDWNDDQNPTNSLAPSLTLNDEWEWYEEIDDAWEAFIDPKEQWLLDGLYKVETYQLSATNTGGSFTEYVGFRCVVAQITTYGPGGGGALNNALYATGGSAGSTVTGFVLLSGLGTESFSGTLPPGGAAATLYPSNGQDGGADTNTLLTYTDSSSVTHSPIMIGRYGFGGQAGPTAAPPTGAVALPADVNLTVVVSPIYYNGGAGQLGGYNTAVPPVPLGGRGGSSIAEDSAGSPTEKPDHNFAVPTTNLGDAGGPGGGGAGIVDLTSATLQAGVGGDGAVVIVLWYNFPANLFVIYEDAWNWFGDNDNTEDNWEYYIDTEVTLTSNSAIPNYLLCLEDAWDWNGDNDTEDNWEYYIDTEVTLTSNSYVPNRAYIIEDAWDWNGDNDDSEDFWMEEEAPPIPPTSPYFIEDPWNWDEIDEEDLWWIDELPVPPLLNLIEDPWNWDETDEEDFWQEEQQPVGPNAPPSIEDVWDWSGDLDDAEDFWMEEEQPSAPVLLPYFIEDPWNWDETDEEDLWWVDEPVGPNYIFLIVEDAWNWNESEEEDFWQEEQQPVGLNGPILIEDAWDWNGDGDDAEDFWMEESNPTIPDYVPAAPLGSPDDWYWDEEVVEDDWYWSDSDRSVYPVTKFQVDTLSVNPPAQTTTVASIGTVTIAIVSNIGIVVTGLTAYARISQVNIWGDIDDNQNPNWVPVDESSPTPPTWTPVSETSSDPVWTPVNETSTTPVTWTPIDNSSLVSPNWKPVKE